MRFDKYATEETTRRALEKAERDRDRDKREAEMDARLECNRRYVVADGFTICFSAHTLVSNIGPETSPLECLKGAINFEMGMMGRWPPQITSMAMLRAHDVIAHLENWVAGAVAELRPEGLWYIEPSREFCNCPGHIHLPVCRYGEVELVRAAREYREGT